MTCKFRIAIIGTGQITAHGHLPAVLASESAELVALIDVVPARATQLAVDFGISKKVATGIEEVADQVDGVIIATPNHTHGSIAEACLQHGLPVLIEKPLATTVAEGEKIIKAAEVHQTLVAVGYCTRFDENARILTSLLEQNYFGQVHRWVYQLGVRDWQAPLSGYSFKKGAAGGGVLIVNGSHFLDRMLSWFGYPTSTEYFDDSQGGPESTALARLHFEDGETEIDGLIRLSKAFRLDNGFVMETEAGVVILPDGPAATITLRPADRPDLEITVQPYANPHYNPTTSLFQRQLEDFVAACRQGRAPMVSARDGLASLRLIEVLYRQRQPLKASRPQQELLTN